MNKKHAIKIITECAKMIIDSCARMIGEYL